MSSSVFNARALRSHHDKHNDHHHHQDYCSSDREPDDQRDVRLFSECFPPRCAGCAKERSIVIPRDTFFLIIAPTAEIGCCALILIEWSTIIISIIAGVYLIEIPDLWHSQMGPFVERRLTPIERPILITLLKTRCVHSRYFHCCQCL